MRKWDIEAVDRASFQASVAMAERHLELAVERDHPAMVAGAERWLARLRSEGMIAPDWIRGPDCIDRHLYAIQSRNLGFGVYKERDAGFVGIREKFDSLYLFTEYHHDAGGTVAPFLDLGLCPVEDLREYGDSKCSMHGRPTFYDQTKPKPNPYAADRNYPGTWCHADDGSVMPDHDTSMATENKELFAWLQQQEASHDWADLADAWRPREVGED